MLYNFGIRLYGMGIHIAALFNEKARRWVAGRRGYWNHLPDVKDQNVVWFHCASLGEFEQGRPVIESWKNEFPNDFILVTFFSPSGYEVKKNDKIADFITYLPLDTPGNARRFIDHFQPKSTFFVKYEFWLNFIRKAKESGSKLYGISVLFRSNQRFFKWYGKQFREALHSFDCLFLQREENQVLLERYGINNTVVAGDTRYDRVADRLEFNVKNRYFEKWRFSNEPVLVIGSSWTDDEALLIPLINNNAISSKVILAPHEVNKRHIDEIEALLSVPYQKYTDLSEENMPQDDTQVIILDCIGVLAEAYKYGSIAYVGGGFGTGLHNILEPAVFGLPVIFGPEFKKFPEAFDFISAGIANSIMNDVEFVKAYKEFSDSEDIQGLTKTFIKSRVGATKQILETIKKASD
ncbi:MAG: 3-deoxy-D-manno-octulosonic acid transferase [Fluviicola sp.]|nr:MAG: 3-deoxy-D-manno-octulosonic acid transferase [Fluviicola sp.]